MLVRAAGPALTPFGVSGAMADPVLRLHEGGGQLQAENDNWGAAPNAAEVAQAGAFPFPADSQDAALLLRLGPGAYTAQVSPASGTGGVALVEVYQLPGD